MKISSSYILFFVVTIALQVLLFNNLTIGTLIAPLVCIACIIMMPLSSTPLRMLCVGVLLGALMDITMGVVGLNVIATLPVAFFRRPILHFLADYSDIDNEGGIPSPKRLGTFRFHRYVVVMVVLHALLFFGFEQLSFDHFWFFVGRLIVSSASTLAVVYLLLAIFTPRLTAAK